MFDTASQRSFLDQLNPEQLAAATHPGGPLLILAGAGTGKTTTLCARMAWLLAEGVPGERILLLTFTRRAARELTGRARALARSATGAPARIVGGTFHSVAHRMVRMHAGALGLPAGFGVLDAGDAADLLDYVRQELGHAAAGGRRFPRAQTVLDIYSRTVNAQRPLLEVLAEAFPWCEEHREPLVEIFRAYGARKRELGVIDLDDLLLYWRALALDEAVGPRMCDAFDHVLIDEYQDVNGLQVDIVAGLRARRREVTAVGDDFQAIYGFRAASARHILEFPALFPEATLVTLERNYRSTAAILAVANSVSDQDEAGYRKQLWTEREGGAAPELHFPLDEADQAHAVCERVLAAREEGVELRRQAVLFRTGHDSDLLELELTRRGIPFVKYGGLRFLEAAHVKDLIAVLRLASNPADEVSWFRLLQLLDGVGPVRARRILDAMRADGEPATPPEPGRFERAAEHVPPGALPQARKVMAALAEASIEQDAGRQVEQLCAALAPLIRSRYADWPARLADFEHLTALAGQATDIRRFVSELVLDPPASSADLAGPPHLDEDFLVLSTVHSAKGLEWEAVHLIAAYDGNFPADMSCGTAEGVREERRLFYVALTRPRRQLLVYVPFRYYHRPKGRDDAHGYGRESRFLTEDVQARFQITRALSSDELDGARPAAGTRQTERRIEVSVDALFG